MISNPTDTFRNHDLLFNATLEVVSKTFASILTDELKCRILLDSSTEDYHFYHARCLEFLTGKPHDLAIHGTYLSTSNLDTKKSLIWVHSQARDGNWDHNFNDALVRQLLTYVTDERLGYFQNLNP